MTDELLKGDDIQVATEVQWVDAYIRDYAGPDDERVVVDPLPFETTDQVLRRICNLDREEVQEGKEIAIKIVDDGYVTARLGRKFRGTRVVYFENLASVPKEAIR